MVGSATWYSSECDLPYMTGPVRNRIWLEAAQRFSPDQI
jgi:hypothetical protein